MTPQARASCALVGALMFCGIPAASAQTPVGPEITANADPADWQEAPSVAMAQDGTGVLVYGGNIYRSKVARWFDSAGRPVGSEPSLHLDGSLGALLFQDVAVNRQGKGAACWEDSQLGFGVCRQLDSIGGLGGREIRASTDSQAFVGREFGPRLEISSDGTFVVGWMDYVQPAVPGSGALALDPSLRFFSAAGEPLGPVILADNDVGGELQGMDVAALGGGRAVIVWNGGGIDSDGLGVRGRIVDHSGVLLGQPLAVNSFEPGYQTRPNVASNLKDRFVVMWESDGQDGSGSGVYGQLFDDLGNKIGPEFQVSSDAPSWQGLPSVAMDRSGRFVVAFYSSFDENDRAEDILLRAYRADGTPLGPQVFVTEADGDSQDYPWVALSDSGLIQVAWQGVSSTPIFENFPDVFTRRYVLPCEQDAYTLCLAGGRFAVRAFWRNRQGSEDLAAKIPLSAGTGGFYFFDPTNFELLVKVLDGCAINDRFWVFAAGLTDVEVDVLVTDTFTGKVVTYHNEQGTAFVPVQDITSFDGCSASAPANLPAAVTTIDPAADLPFSAVPAAGECTAAPDTLCLAGGRFRVKATWTDFAAQNGPATARPQSSNSGLFYFFEPNNLELAVKVLDGCAINGRYWVYAAGLTNVGVSLTVEDLVGGTTWQRSNTLGAPFQPILDSAAFAACP